MDLHLLRCEVPLLRSDLHLLRCEGPLLLVDLAGSAQHNLLNLLTYFA